ncbi:MAG TPA: TolC family protein [Myxococcota bacterium]|nr:TolC family protein [Myxococcota bacterium]HRY94790.1 TolC family protein [Myxococcota bacterium]
MRPHAPFAWLAALLLALPGLAGGEEPQPAAPAEPEPVGGPRRAPEVVPPAPEPGADEGEEGEQAAPQGLGLAEILARALSEDKRIQAAHAKLDAYRARHDEIVWTIFPVIQLELGIGGPIGERKLDCPDDPNCVRLRGNTDNLDSLSLDHLTFAVGGKISGVLPLYSFGKYTAAKKAAAAGVEAGEQDIQRQRQEVALEVRKAWYGWRLASAAVEILEDGEKKLEEVSEKLDKMLDDLDEGVTETDRFKLRYHTAQVRGLLVQARQGRALALAALRFLTDLPGLGETEKLAEVDLVPPAVPPLDRAELVARAQRERPEIRMLRSARRAAQSLADLQRSMFYPDIGIAGYFEGSYSPGQDYIENSLLNNGYTRYGGGLVLGLQVTLDVPQKLYRLERAEAELRQVEAQLELAERAVALDVDRRLGEVEAARTGLGVGKDGQRAAKAWMRSNMMSYGVGLTNTKDLLDSVAAYAKSCMDQDKATHDLLLSLDALRQSLGEDLGELP